MTNRFQNSTEGDPRKLLIVASTHMELAIFFSQYNLESENFVSHRHFDVVITGVGMTATAFALGKCNLADYGLVLNVGIAGSFDKQIELGSLVAVEMDTFAELGAEDHDNFLTIDELGFGKNTFKATYAVKNLASVKGITVNKVHGNVATISKVSSQFNVQTESMEGAAVFYCCSEAKVDCGQVRAISNYVEPRNRDNWQIGLAVKNLNEWLLKFILDYRLKDYTD